MDFLGDIPCPLELTDEELAELDSRNSASTHPGLNAPILDQARVYRETVMGIYLKGGVTDDT